MRVCGVSLLSSFLCQKRTQNQHPIHRPPEGAGKAPRYATASGRIRRPSAGYALPCGHAYRRGGYRLTPAGPGLRAPAHRERQPKPRALSGRGGRLCTGFQLLLAKRGNAEVCPSRWPGLLLGLVFKVLDLSKFKVNRACRRGYRRCASKRGRPRAKASS